MFQWIEKKWISSSPHEAKRRESYGKVASIVGILTNLLIASFKMAIGILSHSISILGDGINNLFDCGSSIISLVTFQIAAKPADKDHPFGHARFEYISSSLVAFIILFVACKLLQDSILKIKNNAPLSFSIVQVVVLLLSISMKLWLYRFYQYFGKKIGSGLILANAADSLSDVFATSSILLAILFSKWLHINLDGPMGIVVSLIIFRSGIQILKETMDHILGDAPNPEMVRSLREKLESYPGVFGTHDMIIHDYGPAHKFITVHVEVNADVDILESHELIDRMERDIEQEEGYQITIHMDPLRVNDERTSHYYHEIKNFILESHPSYSIHDFRIVDSYQTSNLIFDVLVPVEEALPDEAISCHLKEQLAERYPGFQWIITIDRDYLDFHSKG